MLIAFRWLVRLAMALLAVAVLSLGAAYYFAARSLPDYNETLRVAGITAPIEIVRTTEDVPHIFGATDSDVYFALGIVHAQDRLWQMLLARRTAQGRLSELFGTSTLATDELLRRLDLYTLATQSVAAQDSYATLALEAYAQGVNAWIAQVNAGARGRGAPEFFLYEPDIAPWQPADSIAVLKLSALQQTHPLQSEVLRARLSLVSPDYLRDLMPDAPGPAVVALPAFAALFPTAPRRATSIASALPFLPQAPSSASNVFAAAPVRSAAGGSLLANDPHMALSAPSAWYLARLELASGGVIGATLPGTPLVLSGRSAALGWGISASYADDQDLFIEELAADNPDRYRQPEGFAGFFTRRTIIEVKDAAPVTLTLRWSDNGPILPAGAFNLAAITPPGHVVALGWTALSDADTSMSAGLELMRAQSVEAGIAAMEGHMAPSLNLVLADAREVAQVTVGALPARDGAHQTEGRMPSPGWIATNRWQGVLPYASNPRVVAPEGGIVGNTNNKVSDAAFPAHVSFDWGDSQRVQRLQKLMGEREVHSRESFIAAQLDDVSPAARGLLPLIGADLWFTGTPAAEGTPERQRQRALELLAGWDGEMSEHLPEPLIYAAWMRALQNRLIRDELGPLASEFSALEPLFIERVFRDTERAASWCDVVQSAPRETCTDIARTALDAALIELEQQYGSNVESWRWGDAHQATHEHAALGQVPLLSWLVNIKQSTSGGDFTLNRGSLAGVGAEPYRNVQAAGYRGVYDFADPDSSVFILSTGQSGHPLSSHYDDLSELWRRGEYIPMSLDPAIARGAAAGITRLVPQ